MHDPVLHLLIPGLRGPMPGAAQAGEGAPRPATLERWLARAEATPVPKDPLALAMQLHGLAPPPTGSDPATAPLAYLADSGVRPAGVVYHATPVHLRPDQDRLLLFDAPAADLSADQDASLLATLNAHLAADGWRLSAPRPGRWYLHVDAPLVLATRPLGDVLGRNVDRFLPAGPDAAQVRARLTEIQMLLHDHPANAERERSGRLPVSGLWLHGGGVLPQRPPASYALAGDPPPELRGLGLLAGDQSADRLHWLGAAQRAVWDGNPRAWWQAVRQAEALLGCAPAAGTVLYPGDGFAYRWTGRARWRLWRRHRALTEQLLAQDD